MVTLKNLTKRKPPNIPFKKIKDAVLGKKYVLSIVFTGDNKIKELNKKYRKKDKTTNILSFPLSDTEGEIFLNIKQIAKEAEKINEPIKKYFAYIFIHGLLHLKGYSHGSTMEGEEQKILKEFYYI